MGWERPNCKGYFDLKIRQRKKHSMRAYEKDHPAESSPRPKASLQGGAAVYAKGDSNERQV